MKNIYLVFVGLVTMIGSAHGDGYICDLKGQDYNNIGSEISIGIENNTLTFGGSDAEDSAAMNNATGTLDPSYRPRANHVGATRYLITGDSCDEGQNSAIVDQAMITRGNGFLTFVLNCDTDGGSPGFQVYSCQVQ